MKYYKLLTFTLLFCLSACGGEKKDTDATQDSVETVLPDEANEVTIMTLKQTEFNHELIAMVNCPLASWWTYGLSRRNPSPVST